MQDVMKFDPDQYHRRSIRLPNHDYAGPGAYFGTLVTHGREHLFGQVVDGEMYLSALGEIIEEEWQRTDRIRPGVEIGAFAVMPNHTHVIVIVGAHSCAPLRTPNAETFPPSAFFGFICRWFQSCCNKKDQRDAEYAGFARLAAQLLRTRRPERG